MEAIIQSDLLCMQMDYHFFSPRYSKSFDNKGDDWEV